MAGLGGVFLKHRGRFYSARLHPGSEVHRDTAQKDLDRPVSPFASSCCETALETSTSSELVNDAAVANEIVHSMVAAAAAFACNPDLLYTAQQEMARRIEQLTLRR